MMSRIFLLVALFTVTESSVVLDGDCQAIDRCFIGIRQFETFKLLIPYGKEFDDDAFCSTVQTAMSCVDAHPTIQCGDAIAEDILAARVLINALCNKALPGIQSRGVYHAFCVQNLRLLGEVLEPLVDRCSVFLKGVEDRRTRINEGRKCMLGAEIKWCIRSRLYTRCGSEVKDHIDMLMTALEAGGPGGACSNEFYATRFVLYRFRNIRDPYLGSDVLG